MCQGQITLTQSTKLTIFQNIATEGKLPNFLHQVNMIWIQKS